jgi:hypothetical protein
VSFVHAPFWADFITTMVGFKFSVQTGPNLIAHLGNERWISEPQALEGDRPRQTSASSQASPAVQALRSDMVRRTASRGRIHYAAPRRAVLPTMMSISPTRLIDDPNMMQSRVNFKTAPLS